MKKKWIIIIGIIVLLITGLSISGVYFIKSFTEDRKETLAIMEEIKLKYNDFSPLVENFSESRAKFYTAKEDLFFLESINGNREAINTLMTEYNELVMNVHNSSTYLQENCNRKYASSSVNNTCNLFKQGYEAVMNYYMTDIEVYNTLAKEYNNWLTENNLTETPLQEQQFTLYQKYIDYDKDGSYLGGNQNEEEK